MNQTSWLTVQSSAVEADPTAATYLSNRAAAYMSAGDFPSALADCKAADALDPQNEKTLLRMARIHTSLGEADAAIKIFDALPTELAAKDRLPATNMQTFVNRAEQDLKAGSANSSTVFGLEQAEKLLGTTVSPPRKWRLMKAEAQLAVGTERAIESVQGIAMSLLRANNQDPEALVLRGRALYATGENPKALQHFRQALNCDPDYKDAITYLRLVQKLDRVKEEGNAAFKANKFTEAVELYTQALEIDPKNRGTNAKILNNRAMCQSRLKEYDAAIADCDAALRLDQSYIKARKTKAKALGESGDWEAAVAELKSLHEENPQEQGLAKEIRQAELELKKSKRKDLYKLLGVEKDADENTIKKAYRKLAIVHHPDKVCFCSAYLFL